MFFFLLPFQLPSLGLCNSIILRHLPNISDFHWVLLTSIIFKALVLNRFGKKKRRNTDHFFTAGQTLTLFVPPPYPLTQTRSRQEATWRRPTWSRRRRSTKSSRRRQPRGQIPTSAWSLRAVSGRRRSMRGTRRPWSRSSRRLWRWGAVRSWALSATPPPSPTSTPWSRRSRRRRHRRQRRTLTFEHLPKIPTEIPTESALKPLRSCCRWHHHHVVCLCLPMLYFTSTVNEDWYTLSQIKTCFSLLNWYSWASLGSLLAL